MRLPLISRVSYSGMGFISTGKRIGYRFSAVNTTDSRKPDKQTNRVCSTQKKLRQCYCQSLLSAIEHGNDYSV